MFSSAERIEILKSLLFVEGRETFVKTTIDAFCKFFCTERNIVYITEDVLAKIQTLDSVEVMKYFLTTPMDYTPSIELIASLKTTLGGMGVNIFRTEKGWITSFIERFESQPTPVIAPAVVPTPSVSADQKLEAAMKQITSLQLALDLVKTTSQARVELAERRLQEAEDKHAKFVAEMRTLVNVVNKS